MVFRTIKLIKWNFSRMAVGIETRLQAGQPKSPGLIPSRRKRFSLAHMSLLALRFTQPPTEWVLWAVPLCIKQQRHEANHSPPSSVGVTNGGPMPSFLHKSWCNTSLIKARDNFIFIAIFNIQQSSQSSKLGLLMIFSIVCASFPL
jgi:hypothetical protein